MSTSVVVKALRYITEYRGPVAVTPQTAGDVRAGVEDMGSALYWLKTFLHDRIMGREQRVIGRSGDQLEITGHGIPSNAAVRIFPSPAGTTYAGTIPTPLAENTVYYVRVIDADHIELSATSGPGAAVTLTAGIAGDVWIQEVTDWVSNLLVTNATYGSGPLKDLVVWLAGSQTITGAKTFADLTMSGTNKVKVASRALSRQTGQHVTVGEGSGAGSVAVASRAGGILPVTVTNVTTTGSVHIPFDPPNGCSITELIVQIDPAGGHGGLPANMPKIGLYRKDISEVDAVIDEETDASPDVATYETPHNITLTLGAAHVVDKSLYTYFIEFTPENGAGSVTGTSVRGASYTFTTAAYDDGAG